MTFKSLLSMPLYREIWVVFLQGFHFHTYPIQTVITIVALFSVTTSIVGTIVYQIMKLVDVVKTLLSIASEWTEIKNWISRTQTLAQTASNEVSAYKAAISNLQQVASVLNDRLNGVDALTRRLESASTPQANAEGQALISTKEFQLETSNTLDEIREEVRVFMEGVDQHLTALEVEAETKKATKRKKN